MLYGLTMNNEGPVTTVIAAADTVQEMASFQKKAEKFSNLFISVGEVDFYQKIMRFSEIYGMPVTFTHRTLKDQEEFVAHMGLLLESDIVIQNKSRRLAVDEEEYHRQIEAQAYREARYDEIEKGIPNTAKRGKTLAELAGIDKEDKWSETVSDESKITAAMYAQHRRKEGKLTGNSFKEIKDGLMIDRITYEFDENGKPKISVDVAKFTEQDKNKQQVPEELDLSPEGMAAFVFGEETPKRVEGAIYLEDAERLLDMENMDLVHEISNKLNLPVDQLPKAMALKLTSDTATGIYFPDGTLVTHDDFREGINIGAMMVGPVIQFMTPDSSNPISVGEIEKDGVRYFLVK